MNKARRKELGKAFDLVCQAKDILEAVKAEERESYENLPDSFRFGAICGHQRPLVRW